MEKNKVIAIAIEDSQGINATVSAHFGRCPNFIFVNIVNNKIDVQLTIENPFYKNHQPGMIPDFIKQHNANVIIAGGMGPKAIKLFHDQGIDVATGATGSAKTNLEAYLGGTLSGIAPCSHNHPDGCKED